MKKWIVPAALVLMLALAACAPACVSERAPAGGESSGAGETTGTQVLSDGEKALADRGAILDLLQGTVANMAELQSVNVTGNTVMLQFANTSLQDVSRVVASLEGSDLVANVSMSTAKTDRNDEVVSTITVTLAGADMLAAAKEAAASNASSGANGTGA